MTGDFRANIFDNFPTHDGYAINRTGASLSYGSVCSLDLKGTDADADIYTGFVPGTDADTTHPFANLIKPATEHLKGWVFCVSLNKTAVADNGLVKVRFMGTAQVQCTSSGFVEGDMVMPANAVHTVTILTDGLVTVGIALQKASATAATPTWILFNGFCFGAAGAKSSTAETAMV